MIEFKNPPFSAIRVLHLNKSSQSPGGKDYVLVKMANGELWAINGPSNNVRNGGGAIQHPKKSWQEMVTEKSNKGYQVIGEYVKNHLHGSWWSQDGSIYKDVPNIPITLSPPPQSNPEQEPPKTAVRIQQHSSIAEQYPLSDKVRKAFVAMPATNDWFCII
jgi:hypothetical protein